MANLLQNEIPSTSNVRGESSDSTIEINVMTLDSQIYSFQVNRDMPVSVFKETIANDIGVPVGQQRLIFTGRVLCDDHCLSEYHLENGHTLHLVARQLAQSQPSSNTSAEETNRTSSTLENDANAGAPHIRVGEVSQSVLLGTANVEGQGEGVVSYLSPVIDALIDSIGMGGQSGINSGNFGAQFSTLPILNALNTLSESMRSMEGTPSRNGNNTEELPTNGSGFPGPEALSIVLHQAQRLLSGHTSAVLSHLTERLEQVRASSDQIIIRQIQDESVQAGNTMQHLGFFFLELGRVIQTLRMGQSPQAESSVNSGPAVYISPSGPNLLMVQPFSIRTSSLFGSPVRSADAVGFGPVGVGNSPRNINIHIHAGTTMAPTVSAVGTRTRNGGVQGHDANTTDSTNLMGWGLDSNTVVPVRNVNMATFSGRPTGVAISSPAQPGLGFSVSQQPLGSALLSSYMNEPTSQLGNFVGSMQEESQVASGLGGGQGGGIDLSQMVQQMMPADSRAPNGGSSVPQPSESRSTGTVNHEVHDLQIGIQQVGQSTGSSNPPEAVLHIVVESSNNSQDNGIDAAEDLVNDILHDIRLIEEYIEILEREIRRRHEENAEGDE